MNMNEDKYEVLKNEKYGRYMVARKIIKAGELILSEKPTMVGPPIEGPLTCFNCCKNIERHGFVFCKKCGSAIMCSPKCTGIFHTKEECELFKKANINGKGLVENNQVTFPLRCILLREYKPNVWKLIQDLESHLELRRNTPIWKRHKIAVEQVLRCMNLISDEDIAAELVQKICGLLDVNTFELRPPQTEGEVIMSPVTHHCLRGLYPKASLIAHDCTGNTFLSVDDDYNLTIKASIDIPENDPILFSYANILHGSIERRQHLREGKYFICTCKKCSDPTESNTEISSLKCHKCRRGVVRKINAATENSDWECSECQKTFKNFLVNLTVDEGRRRIQDVDRNDMNSMEKLLSKMLRTFHEHHFLILEIKQAMVGWYTFMPPTRNNLQKKIRLCQSLIEVFSKIEPGISRIKAMTLYQLQSSMIDLANKEYNDKAINLEELFSKLMNAEMKLKDCIKYLLHEPRRSPEGRIAQMALSELKMLRTSIDNIKNDLLLDSLVSKRGRAIENKKRDKKCQNDKMPTEVNKIVEIDITNSQTISDNPNMTAIRKKKNKRKH